MNHGYENPDGTWTNVLDDGTEIHDRDVWRHDPSMIANARAVVAARKLRALLIDSWCVPLLDWLTRALTR